MSRPIRSHTFRGRRCWIRWVPRLIDKDGEDKFADCDVGAVKHPTIRYSQYMAKRHPGEAFENMVHEGIHRCFEDLDEESVEAAARDIVRYLKREGFHRDK